jgi:hypothetical protein
VEYFSQDPFGISSQNSQIDQQNNNTSFDMLSQSSPLESQLPTKQYILLGRLLPSEEGDAFCIVDETGLS